MATAADFRRALVDAMHETTLKRKQFLDITASKTHATIGGY